MAVKLGEVASRRASEILVGREADLAALGTLLDDNGPLIFWVHGIAGVGKSTLLDAFLSRARAGGAIVVRLDGRAIEPTERGFLDGLSAAIGGSPAGPAEAAERLGRIGLRVLLAIDNYELLRLIDTWLRQVFVPALPNSVRLLVVGREPAFAGWRDAPGWTDLFRDMRLATLTDAESDDVLRRIDVPESQRPVINRYARGHPLALRVAGAALKGRSELDLEHVAGEAVFELLTRLYLRDLDPSTRDALDGASVIRRTTRSLLSAIFPDRAPQDVFDRLRGLPFVELGPDGLVIHDAIQKLVAAALKATDPARYRQCRYRAWRQLRSEVRTAGISDLWRYTADLLYLVENPVVREAFFPSTSTAYAVEPARPDDADAIAEILRRHEPPTMAAAILGLWDRMPQAFRVVRDRPGTVAGVSIWFEAQAMSATWLAADPLLQVWWKHLRDYPMPRDQRAIFYRRWLDREAGELPCATQAAAWLDLKRAYMELRPQLRRVYSVVRDLEAFGPIVVPLGFNLWPGSDFEVDGVLHHASVLDFGPSSVDGWLSGLITRELGIDETDLLAVAERQLVLDGRRIDLSKLEFDVMQFLYEREGRPVPRRAIMEAVWGHDVDTASNVLEAVVKSLRKKLGDRSDMIETVRGVGYRFIRSVSA